MTRRVPVRPWADERGAALLAALCFATVLLIALGSYMTVCYRTLALSTRSLHASQSVELAELGMEDALSALNQNNWTGWSISGSTATKTIGGFSFGSGVTGAVNITIASYNGSAGPRVVTVDGTTTMSDSTNFKRTLTASSSQAALFTNALAATTGLVKFTSAGAASLIDGYDSSKGAYTAAVQSPNYRYSAILSSGSTSTSAATVQLTNAQVKGYVATLSTGPSYSTSATLSGPSTPPTTRIDPSRISTSPYQPVFSIKTPTGSGSVLGNPSSSITLGTAGATTPAIYYCSGLDVTGSVKITIAGPVQIVMSGSNSFYLGLHGGSPSIEIATTGSLEVFSAGDIAIYGNGINNLTTEPRKCAIYSSNTLTVPDMNTSTAFYGVIYTPNGDFKVASNNAIYGAIVARNITFSGSAPVVHYDLNLRNVVFPGIDTPYAVANWRESTHAE